MKGLDILIFEFMAVALTVLVLKALGLIPLQPGSPSAGAETAAPKEVNKEVRIAELDAVSAYTLAKCGL